MKQWKIAIIIIAIILTVMIFVLTDNQKISDNQNPVLELERSHSSIYHGERISFWGSLTDGSGIPLSFQKIIILEYDGGDKYQLITSTTTDIYGNYQISINAEYWDEENGPFEIIANFPGSDTKNEVYSKLYSVNIGPSENSAHKILQNSEKNFDNPKEAFLTMDLIEGHLNQIPQEKTFRVYPDLRDLNGKQIPHPAISLYINDTFKILVSSNMWSHNIACIQGHNSIFISTNYFIYDSSMYDNTNSTNSIYCK